jgi:hypothetical protein
MKTIREAVKEMNRQELESIALTYYAKLNFQLKSEIVEKRRNPNRGVTNYHIIRNVLMREDLFNPKYDELLDYAVKGELSIQELITEVQKIE